MNDYVFFTWIFLTILCIVRWPQWAVALYQILLNAHTSQIIYYFWDDLDKFTSFIHKWKYLEKNIWLKVVIHVEFDHQITAISITALLNVISVGGVHSRCWGLKKPQTSAPILRPVDKVSNLKKKNIKADTEQDIKNVKECKTSIQWGGTTI